MLVVAVVRDLFDGEAMARIMSLVFMVFMVIPVLAPSVGQLILLFAPWRAIFLVLAAYGLDYLCARVLAVPYAEVALGAAVATLAVALTLLRAQLSATLRGVVDVLF